MSASAFDRLERFGDAHAAELAEAEALIARQDDRIAGLLKLLQCERELVVAARDAAAELGHRSRYAHGQWRRAGPGAAVEADDAGPRALAIP